jgi:hypothetical protein
MAVKVSKRGTTFFRFKVYFELKIRESLGFEFDWNLMEFHLGASNLDDTWTNDVCLHLVSNPTHNEEFKVQTRNLGTWS